MAVAPALKPRASRWRRAAAPPAHDAAPGGDPPAGEPSKAPNLPSASSCFGAGDSYLVPQFLGPEEADEVLHSLTPVQLGGAGEVAWFQMYGADAQPFGRLKFTQATIEQGVEPIYRYPTNNQAACKTQPWSPTVGRLKDQAEKMVGHALNHCVGNLYQDQHDFIGPHTDKTLDILYGSCILSISLGAERPIVLERRGRDAAPEKQVIELQHGSLFVIGPETNRLWTHAIPTQTRDLCHRISLTLRQMGTFHDLQTGRIIGQGAEAQTLNWPQWKHNMSIGPTVVYQRAQPLNFELRASHAEGGSTFECVVRPCADFHEALRLHVQLREEHPGACHIPYAWVLRPARRQPSQARSRQPRAHRGGVPLSPSAELYGADGDGEPEIKTQGLSTGRDGVLKPLLRSGWTNCAAFVVRHWDGVHLGADCLVRAYAEVTAAAAGSTPAAEPTCNDGGLPLNTLAIQQGEEDRDPPAVVKEARKLQKALRQIATLEERLAGGEALFGNQLAKVEKRAALEHRLRELKGVGS